MSNSDTIITCASWEDRFMGGLKRNFEKHPGAQLAMFYFEEYSNWTSDSRTQAMLLAQSQGVSLRAIPLQNSTPVATWKQVQGVLAEAAKTESRCLIDCSTMPRELLWYVLWTFGSHGKSADFVYHRPESYAAEWLSREPMEPRLVLNMSGIARLGRRTALVIAVGYDTERVANLLRVFEPAVAVLVLQKTTAFRDNPARMKEHRDRFARYPSVIFNEVDAYDVAETKSVLQPVVSELLSKHNVLMSSLGPKLSALSLYAIQRDAPEAGLIYNPAREFNKEYSKGIGTCIEGTIDAPTPAPLRVSATEWLRADDLDLNKIPPELLVT